MTNKMAALFLMTLLFVAFAPALDVRVQKKS
jgi:hypothetical protein